MSGQAPQPIMVLGAARVFGSRLCRLLLEGGAHVVGVGRRTAPIDALVHDLSDLGSLEVASGARPCLNEVAPDAILETLSPYAITTRATREHPVPLYRKALGTAFEQVPGAIRALHDRTTDHAAQGLSVITIGDNPVDRALSSLGLLPKPGTEVPSKVTFTIRDGRERWHRQFGAFGGSSVLGWPEHGVVWERFGLLKGRADLVAYRGWLIPDPWIGL